MNKDLLDFLPHVISAQERVVREIEYDYQQLPPADCSPPNQMTAASELRRHRLILAALHAYAASLKDSVPDVIVGIAVDLEKGETVPHPVWCMSVAFQDRLMRSTEPLRLFELTTTRDTERLDWLSRRRTHCD